MAKNSSSVVRRDVVLVVLAGLVGCRAGDTRQTGARPGGAAISTAGLAVAPSLPGDHDPAPPSPAALPDGVSLVDRMAREASSRPATAVRSEALVIALEAQGISVARTRQVLGKTLRARYCGLAVTATGLVASVCEYDSAPEAVAAMKDSVERFGKAMPNRRLLTNGNSLLTIANVRDAVEAEARTVAQAFAALSAT
jgi:hypothetical protein